MYFSPERVTIKRGGAGGLFMSKVLLEVKDIFVNVEEKTSGLMPS